jgi:hypothetical protein
VIPPSDDGWIDHDGGPCPVADEQLVLIRTRDGWEDTTFEPAGWWADGTDWWQHRGLEDDITAYRVVQP